MTRYESYEQVKALSLDAQRALLRRGDNEERIWATWAVADALGSGFAPDLNRQVAAEPTAGVRRHMIVVLAGMGEYALLREFAARDPDPMVRATGCQYVLRTTADTREARRYALGRLETDAARDVCKAVVLEAIRKADVLTLEDLVALASNGVTEIRVAAVHEVARQDLVSMALNGGLDRCLLTEPDDELLDHLVQLVIESGQASHVLRAVEQGGTARRLRLLDLLIEREQSFDWSQLQALAEDSGEDADVRVISLLDEIESRDALSWLVGRLARRVRDGAIEDWQFADAAGKVLETAVEQFIAEPASPPKPGDLVIVRTWVEKRIEEFERWEGWEDWDDLYDEEEYRAAKKADLDLLKKSTG